MLNSKLNQEWKGKAIASRSAAPVIPEAQQEGQLAAEVVESTMLLLCLNKTLYERKNGRALISRQQIRSTSQILPHKNCKIN